MELKGAAINILGDSITDGLHPSDEGHAIIAHRLGEFLKML